jgi:hypothetical protein
MNLFLDTHQELIVALLHHEVDFIIIGGYAVIFHGYHRTTGDVNIWLKPDNDNKWKLIKALEDFGLEHSAMVELENLDFQQHLAFHIGAEPEKIEFLTHINGVQFDEANLEKITADIDQLKIPFLHYNHLILSKINTGRLKGQADIEELQKIHLYKK